MDAKKIVHKVDAWLNHQKHNIIEAERILKQKDSEEHQHHALLVAIHTSLEVRTVFQKVCTRVVRTTVSQKKREAKPITLPCDTHSEIGLNY